MLQKSVGQKLNGPETVTGPEEGEAEGYCKKPGVSNSKKAKARSVKPAIPHIDTDSDGRLFILGHLRGTD